MIDKLVTSVRSKFHAEPLLCCNCLTERATMESWDHQPLCVVCAVAIAKSLTAPKLAPSIKARRGRR
jgi:hypothetical protein